MPSAEDAATLQAWFEGVEHARAEVEATWGVGRLSLLVDDILRAKFNRQKVKWSAALQTAWAAVDANRPLTRDMMAAVEEHAGGMKRAWAALAAVATEAGHRPIAPWIWEVPLADGTVAALVQTDAEAAKVIADGRHLSVWTAREIANVIDALAPALQMAKVVFPGATVLPQSDAGPFDVKRGDPIPFDDATEAAA